MILSNSIQTIRRLMMRARTRCADLIYSTQRAMRRLVVPIRTWLAAVVPIAYNKSKRIFNFWAKGATVIFFCIGLGATILIGAASPPVPNGLFYLAYFLFAVAFIWSLGSFLTSEFLKVLYSKTQVKNRNKRKIARGRQMIFRVLALSVALAITGIFLFSVWLTHYIQSAREFAELEGVLIPADEPDPPPRCPGLSAPPTALKIYFGSTLATTSGRSLILIRAKNTELIGMERRSDNTIAFNANIRSADGKVVALITRNHFTVNRNNIIEPLFSRPDRSTLLITDQYSNQLRVKLLNSHSLIFKGKLYYGPDGYVEFTDDEIKWEPGGRTLRGGCIDVETRAAILLDLDQSALFPSR